MDPVFMSEQICFLMAKKVLERACCFQFILPITSCTGVILIIMSLKRLQAEQSNIFKAAGQYCCLARLICTRLTWVCQQLCGLTIGFSLKSSVWPIGRHFHVCGASLPVHLGVEGLGSRVRRRSRGSDLILRA